MAYDQSVIQQIIQLSRQGYSSREIAEELKIGSKSTVNNILNKFKDVPEETTDGPKILVFDLETSAAVSYAFGRHKVFLNSSNVVREGGRILTAAWSWLGSGVVESFSDIEQIKNNEDSNAVALLWELFNQADAVIAHNGLAFDVKMLKTRAVANGFSDLPSVKVIDTLQMARKNFRFPSNRLDELGAYLNLGRKNDTGGIELWIKVQQGDEQALKDMIAYNKQDVILLEKVYMKLRGFGHKGTTFNAALYYDDGEEHCAVCGSSDVELTGRKAHTAVSVFEEVRCNSCGSVHRKRKAINSKEQRVNISVTTTT